ncbi:hypothetical protein Rctr71_042 [Virus Rctr71]|nr:hypothetical protein Rctr71_042 [Virus Rctr71]
MNQQDILLVSRHFVREYREKMDACSRWITPKNTEHILAFAAQEASETQSAWMKQNTDIYARRKTEGDTLAELSMTYIMLLSLDREPGSYRLPFDISEDPWLLLKKLQYSTASALTLCPHGQWEREVDRALALCLAYPGFDPLEHPRYVMQELAHLFISDRVTYLEMWQWVKAWQPVTVRVVTMEVMTV